MDKNTGIGLALIAAIIIGFSILTKPSQKELEKERHYQDSVKNIQTSQVKEEIERANSAQDTAQPAVNDFFQINNNDTLTSFNDTVGAINTTSGIGKTVVLENSKVKITFNTKGGQISSVLLKNYKTFKGDSLYLIKNDAKLALELMNKKGIRLNTDQAAFKIINNSTNDQTLVMRMNFSETQYIDFIYALSPEAYMLKYDVAVVGMENILSVDCLENFVLKWQQNLRRQEKNEKNEQHYARLHYKSTDGNFDGLSETHDDKKEITFDTKWIGYKDQFFASAFIADNSFTNANLESKMLQSDQYLKDYSAALSFKPVRGKDNILGGGFKFYFGPLDYYRLKGYDDNIKDASQQLELDKLVPLGWTLFRWVNKYFIMPLFELLNSTGMQMGLVILLLTVIVKLIISPLTYKSFMSSAKMRVLKPQVDEINGKYQGEDKAMERQKAVMKLYSDAGVNPMSGCVPMLLQMPILIALFQFFPSALELRQQSFLWATDLSTYDAIIEWKTNIPLLSSWLGNHLSLFCVLMTVTNIIYTKFNMDATNTGQQQMPGMKWMMYLMPLVFFFVLNNYPSGLTYYYFLSTLMTILITLAFRYFVDENKVLAKLEENKKKPKKKGFMARLQEQAEQAQKTQQQQSKGKNKPNKNKGQKR